MRVRECRLNFFNHLAARNIQTYYSIGAEMMSFGLFQPSGHRPSLACITDDYPSEMNYFEARKIQTYW